MLSRNMLALLRVCWVLRPVLTLAHLTKLFKVLENHAKQLCRLGALPFLPFSLSLSVASLVSLLWLFVKGKFSCSFKGIA